MEIVDEILTVIDEDASKYAHLLAENEGILAGISGAANVWAAVELAKRPENKGKRIVTVLPDSGERYLTTWLYEEFAKNAEDTDKKLNQEILKTLDHTMPYAVALSLRYFQNGLYCSEAILRGFNEAYDLGFPPEQYKIATAFGSGLGECGMLLRRGYRRHHGAEPHRGKKPQLRVRASILYGRQRASRPLQGRPQSPLLQGADEKCGMELSGA